MTSSPGSRLWGTGKRTRVLVLLSGGIDSAALVSFYKRRRFAVVGLHFDYGQPSRRTESRAAARIADHFGIPLQRLRLSRRLSALNGEYWGRNAAFVLLAAGLYPGHAMIVGLGIHEGLTLYDSTGVFVADLQRLLDGYSGGTLSLGAPFVNHSKAQIVADCRRHRVPLHLTYSCERRSAPACGKCPSCLDRRALHVD